MLDFAVSLRDGGQVPPNDCDTDEVSQSEARLLLTVAEFTAPRPPLYPSVLVNGRLTLRRIARSRRQRRDRGGPEMGADRCGEDELQPARPPGVGTGAAFVEGLTEAEAANLTPLRADTMVP